MTIRLPPAVTMEAAATAAESNDPNNHNRDDEEEEEEEEKVYVAAQIFGGNLDDQFILGGGRVKRNGASAVNGSAYNDNDDDDDITVIGKRRGIAVLDMFNVDIDVDEEATTPERHMMAGRKQNQWSDHALDCLKRNELIDGYRSSNNAHNSHNKTQDICWWKLLRRPVVSTAHVCVADGLVSDALHMGHGAARNKDGKTSTDLYRRAREHLEHALKLWPCNPSALMHMANLKRMGVMNDDEDVDDDATNKPTAYASGNSGPDSDSAVRRRMHQAMQLYIAAARSASKIRAFAFQLLQPNNIRRDDGHNSDAPGDDYSLSTDDAFLIETIVLGAAQVELLDDTDQNQCKNDEENESTSKDDHERMTAKGGNVLVEATSSRVSALTSSVQHQSKVISTASYMAALLASALGQHQIAADALAAFGSNLTRIHPAVWEAAETLSSGSTFPEANDEKVIDDPTQPADIATSGVFIPSIFKEAIPKPLANILRHAFRPDAPYYRQSGYDRGVYYSFWSDYRKSLNKDDGGSDSGLVSNAVEDVILSHLLPRVKEVVGEEALSQLEGFEWWVHTRPHGANLGHQLHFDTDEALLDQDRIVSFPICATVLYLNDEAIDDDTTVQGNHKLGATVVFDQTPYSEENAKRAWVSVPKARSFLVFPGNLLHGVLPCAPLANSTENKNTKRRKVEDDDSEKKPTPHRLTFMVNFWGRNIPERLKHRKLYGPSGPFPPKTRRHSWTYDLLDGGSYPRIIESTAFKEKELDATIKSKRESLTVVEPAWDVLNFHTAEGDDDEHSEGEFAIPANLPPSGINVRFFVKNAPSFFHSTLYEK